MKEFAWLCFLAFVITIVLISGISFYAITKGHGISTDISFGEFKLKFTENPT